MKKVYTQYRYIHINVKEGTLCRTTIHCQQHHHRHQPTIVGWLAGSFSTVNINFILSKMYHTLLKFIIFYISGKKVGTIRIVLQENIFYNFKRQTWKQELKT